MDNLLKCYVVILCIVTSLNANSQFLCDFENKIIKKQKKAIEKKAENIVKEWYRKNANQLNLPRILKFSKISIKTNEDLQWKEIDSLLCIKGNSNLIAIAKNRLIELKLAVFDIRAYFNFENTKNQGIKSILYFKFDIQGNLIVAVIREKENSPFSERYYH